MHDAQNIAAKFLGVPYGSLDERTQTVASGRCSGMRNHSPIASRSGLIGNCPGSICRAVVDDDHLDVEPCALEKLKRRLLQAAFGQSEAEDVLRF